MALHWSVENCDNSEAFIKDEEWHITQVIVFMTMGIGISSITAKNVDAFYQRCVVWQACVGPSLRMGGKDAYITREDIAKRVGLYTNATRLTMTEFIRKCSKGAEGGQRLDTERARTAMEAMKAKESA